MAGGSIVQTISNKEHGRGNFDNAPKRVPDLHSQLDHQLSFYPQEDAFKRLDIRLDFINFKIIRSDRYTMQTRRLLNPLIFFLLFGAVYKPRRRDF